MTFITEDFLLQTPSAQRLYHEYAEEMPIIDYHCHLPPREIAEDRSFENMTRLWLAGDHYKWRAMRAAGVGEEFITGDASDWAKFEKWTGVFPLTLRNPLFHWTMLELNRPFGITDLFPNPENARELWDRCNAMLAAPEFSARGLMKRMDVQVVCTTDDPVDDLVWHQKIAADNASGAFTIRVLPTFRPDRALPTLCTNPEKVAEYNAYLKRLGAAADVEINSFAALLNALSQRHDFFHENGCRLADHGFELFEYSDWEAFGYAPMELAFGRILAGKAVSPEETQAISSAILFHLGRRHAARDWAMQLHIGAIRNNSTWIFNRLGPDAGCDSIVDGAYAKPLARFLDRLDREEILPKTVVYNLNPASNYMLASMVANFNDGLTRGKMQYGSGWWFLDQRDGMLRQLETVSTMGLLPLFVGMLTDSRSFLSYTRHEYFRRILCDLLGGEMERGLLPNDFSWIGRMVQDVCYHNANRFFGPF